VLLADLVRASDDVAATSSRRAKVERLASCIAAFGRDEIRAGVAYLSGTVPGEATGIGWAALRDVPPPTAAPASLEIVDVAAALHRIRSLSGAGSRARRVEELADLFGGATDPEQRFLRGLLSGELRQGALEGVMTEAIARAADVPAAHVRRAAMLSGDLSEAAEAALVEGSAGLERFHLTPLRPVQPMLAQSADGVEEALARVRPAAVEWKLDGARIQVHRAGDDIRVFTRNLADVTSRVPEVVDAVRALGVETLVLDGEAIALRADGRALPFQVTMSRFGTRTASSAPDVPLTSRFFDVLHVDGRDTIDLAQRERFAVLQERLPAELLIPHAIATSVEEATAFLDDALARGHEGIVVKALDAPYEAGRRGGSWLKVKRAHTLDLVVLAAEWGHGRRRGWLSNLHLGARDPASGGYAMLGKTFKGMTDEVLEWQTKRLLELETSRDAFTVSVRPELVVEVAFDGIQTSPRYASGLALRFARIKGYRPDKRPEDADTIETVRAIHAAAHGT
jgi:DNA ligase-1